MSERTTRIKVAMLLTKKEVGELAEELGVTREYLSSIINGKRIGNSPTEILEEVERKLNIKNLVCEFKSDKEAG